MNLQNTTQRLNKNWTYLNSAICLLVILLSLVLPTERRAELLVPILGLLSFTVLFVSERENRFNLPNLLTLSRIIAGLIVFIYVTTVPNRALGENREGGYLVFLLLAGIELTDFLDGFVARRIGATSFGARLDMEADAYFMYLLAYIAHFQAGLGSWILAIGSLRYIFAFPSYFLPDSVETQSVLFKFFAKSVCALSVIALVSVTAPFLSYAAKAWLNIVSLALLVTSFLWEAALRVRAVLLQRKPVHE